MRYGRALLLPAAILMALAVTQHTSQASHESDVRAARVSVLDSGDAVVSVETSGALPGLLTVNATRDANGVVTGGAWTLVVKYVEDLNADGSVRHDEDHVEDEDGPHREYIRIVNRGMLTGRVASGLTTVASDGSLLLTNLQLTVEGGSLTFEGASGHGSLDVDPRLTGAQGTLRLDF